MKSEKIFTKITVESNIPKSLVSQALSKENLERYKKDITEILSGELDEGCTLSISVVYNDIEY